MRGPRALAYHAGGLGDFVLSLPALMRLAQSHPEATWHYWGPRERLALLPGWQPAPAELLRAEASLWGDRPEPEAAGWLAAADPVVAFAANPPPWLPAAPQSLSLRAFSPDLSAPPEWVPRFQTRQLDRAGVPRVAEPWLPGWRRRVLPQRPGGRLVLHPGSGDRAKNLPLDTWRAALDPLARELGLQPLVLAGPVEQERGESYADWGVERAACATLSELLDLLAGASLVLANDSGVAHLAGLLGIPTVVAFGPSAPCCWRPLGPRVAVVSSPLACAPCCRTPPIACARRACLEALRAPVLIGAARGLFAMVVETDYQESRPLRR